MEFFCRIADEKKVSDVIVLEVSGLTPIADYFVIGTCENPLHIDAVAASFVNSTLSAVL